MVQFDKPREEMNGLLNEMITVVENLATTLDSENETESMNHNLFKDFLKLMLEKINNYKFTLMRDYLKCVFVGRTSNGKSSVINAILKQNDLPTGIGHTTNCCVLIHSGNKNETYVEHFLANDQINPKSVFSMDKLKPMCHALSKEKIDSQDTIKVTYPNKHCPIINPNVYFVDSPGIDIEQKFDSWIDKYCLDADLFVLVCNAESILMQCERNFFYKVKNQFLMPNVIIVNNRWDASIDQPNEQVERVKKQHMDAFTEFLVKDLKICKESEVESRVFFISAQEEIRSKTDTEHTESIPRRSERKAEFERLEKLLEKNLSPDAVNQKLVANFTGMEKVFEELNSFVNCLFNTIIIEKDIVKKNLAEQTQFFKNMETNLPKVNQKALIYIDSVVRKAKDRIATDFQSLICNLDVSTDAIQVNFNPFNRKEYMDYQKFLVENIETLFINSLNTKTMAKLNELLKSGFEKLTMIYTEALITKSSVEQSKLPPVSSCQPPIPALYPEFSPIMNNKIGLLKQKVPVIPPQFSGVTQCAQYLDSVENRFITYCKVHVDDIAATGATIASHSGSKYPEVTLMVPKFSTVILTDFTFNAGFQFTLSPNNIRLFWLQQSQTHCPIRSKVRSINVTSVVFCVTCGGICYMIISFHGKLWKHGLFIVLGIYGVLFVFEKFYWTMESEMQSLKNQFITHAKIKMEAIIHISAVTTARQLGSYLHLDLKGLETGAETIILDFHNQIDKLIALETIVLSHEKKLKKIKSSMYVISQQIAAFKKNIIQSKYGIVK